MLFEQVRQMWLARGACVKLMNRQREVNAAVRKYKTADKEFGTALLEMKTDSAALGVTAGFDYLSGFMSLQTLCYMEVLPTMCEYVQHRQTSDAQQASVDCGCCRTI